MLSHINCFEHHLNQLTNWAKLISYYFIQFRFSVSNMLSYSHWCQSFLPPFEHSGALRSIEGTIGAIGGLHWISWDTLCSAVSWPAKAGHRSLVLALTTLYIFFLHYGTLFFMPWCLLTSIPDAAAIQRCCMSRSLGVWVPHMLLNMNVRYVYIIPN